MDQRLTSQLTKWNLSSPRKLASTPTSEVYHVSTPSGPAILKLLTILGIEDEARGALALRHFNGEGAAKLLESDANAHLLEFIEGSNLTSLSMSGKDSTATEIFSEVLLKLHQPKATVRPEGLTL